MRKQYLYFTHNILPNIIRLDKRPCYFIIITIITSVIVTASFCSRAPDKPGLKIVSLSPAMTEILFAIGAEPNLVGVTTFCNYPEQTKQIYKVGDFSHPSIERIVGLNPNMVIVNLPEQMRIKQQLDDLKINVFISSPKSLSDVYNEIIEIGKIVNREERADSLVHYMQTHITPCANKRLKRVYIELSPRPLVTVGQTSFLNELLERAGAKNIFSDLQKDYPVVAQEEVIRRNPEIIILLHPEEIENRLGWQTIAAIENAQVYRNLNQDHLMRAGPRLVHGFEALKKILCE